MPIITKIGGNRGKDGRERAAVTWVDIDVADPQGRAWLSAWQAIGDPARAILLEPVRLSHREYLEDGLLLSLRAGTRVPEAGAFQGSHPLEGERIECPDGI